MNSLNSILLEGNLTADPEIRSTPNGTEVLTFSIGNNRSYKVNDEYVQEASFFNVEVWGRLATACANNLSKGRGVRVVGRLKQDRWTDEYGAKRSKVKIVGEHVEFKPIVKKESAAEPAETVTV